MSSWDQWEHPAWAPVGDPYGQQWKALGAWFLGPRAENRDVFMDTYKEVFEKIVQIRNNYFPSDPAYVTQAIKSSRPYQKEVENMKKELLNMAEEMADSVPFYSPRFQGHMNWDVSMPALLGYMGAMLFNQNNVDSSASPVTTLYEKNVGQQLCDMLGYNITHSINAPVAWGHITCGGSIANIEALWASRNIKFVPLAVEAALQTYYPGVRLEDFLREHQVTAGLNTQQQTCNKSVKGQMDPYTWRLLNMDIDDICELAHKVIEAGGFDEEEAIEFKKRVEEHGVMSLGLSEFLRAHNIEQFPPIYTAPANNHYSWPKAGSLLGLGSNALKEIHLDENFRQDYEELKNRLQICLENTIPVIAVVAVIGSTEESAVDPIKKIDDLRNDFKKYGLNFALLADAAWGGYFKTMLNDKKTDDKSSSRNFDGFVPQIPLSAYVKEQYRNIQVADTITIDPHKAGFCPYPSGSLCYRNNQMRYPIALFHPEVYHGTDDPTMGVYGIEGSKPGAAPAGVLMSHNVIGLDFNGYGRILGQCTTTAKLFYAMWLTVARDDDPFVCVPLQRIPEGFNMHDTKIMIQQEIAYKSMEDIYKNGSKHAKKFLKECGPDTMINTFVVNFKNNTKVNTDVEEANKLQVALSDSMNIYVGAGASRVPLIIMQSGLNAKKHGIALKHYKKRVGLDEDDKDLNVMVNSCMNPWQSNESIFAIGDLFRMITLNCIYRIKDRVVPHTFILSGESVHEAKDESIFIEYITKESKPEYLYQVSAKVEPESKADLELLNRYIKSCRLKKDPVLFETVNPKFYYSDNKTNLYNLLHLKDWDCQIPMMLVHHKDKPIIKFKILDIPRYQRLDMSSHVTYPKKQTCFIYGDSTRTIMSHAISDLPDAQYLVTLSERPHSLTETMLQLGVMVEVEGVDGAPLRIDGEIKDPLQRDCYDISFKGELDATIHTSINIKDRVYFAVITESVSDEQ